MATLPQSTSLIDVDDWAEVFRQRDRERKALALDAVARRDMPAALEAMDVGRQHCFVWPETYPATRYYQRLSWCKAIPGFPVVMRAAKTSIYARHTKAAYCIRVAERFIRRYKLTEIGDCQEAVRDLLNVICERHGANAYVPRMWSFVRTFDGVVLVNGKMVPISPDRLRVLEKSIAIVEKIDRLGNTA